MSDLVDITDKLQATTSLIAGYEKSLVRRPESRALLLNLQSLEQRRRFLQNSFDETAANVGIDVCSYRFLPEQGAPKLAGITSTLQDYQYAVSRFYDAVMNGPKRGGPLPIDVVQATAFDFGYTFAGSVGFVFTIPNERLLLIDSALDRSIGLIFEASKATTPNEILAFSRQVGPAPIRALYKWVNSHAKSHLSVDIQWRRGRDVRKNVLVEWQEFERLEETLSRTSEVTRTELKVVGVLLGIDLKPDLRPRSFHLKPDGDAADIRGGVIETITPEMEAKTYGKRCIATIEVATTILFSTDEPKTIHTLLHLEPTDATVDPVADQPAAPVALPSGTFVAGYGVG